jgi:nitrite reductase/ring-hydroxylating ferredoxin subunit
MSEFEKFAETSELQEGKIKVGKVRGTEVWVANIEGTFHAYPNKCTHMGGPVGRGKMTGYIIQCPWHGSRFDVRTGQVVGGPAQLPLSPFEVKVEGAAVWVELP